MFRKLDVAKLEQTKSSVARGIRGRIAEQYPQLEDEDVLDELIPKKCVMTIAKTAEKNAVIVVDGAPLFFQLRDGPYFPTLKVLHRYPDMMPKLRVDKGAIKFVFQGANIMCPGLTSPGAQIHDEVEEDTPVAIYAEDKTHALAVGITKMSAFTSRATSQVRRARGVEKNVCSFGILHGRLRGVHPPQTRVFLPVLLLPHGERQVLVLDHVLDLLLHGCLLYTSPSPRD